LALSVKANREDAYPIANSRPRWGAFRPFARSIAKRVDKIDLGLRGRGDAIEIAQRSNLWAEAAQQRYCRTQHEQLVFVHDLFMSRRDIALKSRGICK
jgi:hypothetical protein